MQFIEAIRNSLSQFPEGTAERVILNFLLKNGVGRANAQPWKSIEFELVKHGFAWRLQKFQQGLLKKSREGEMFIGSNDHGKSRGFYIIADQADANLMAEWYRKRIASETARLSNLEKLIAQQWP